MGAGLWALPLTRAAPSGPPGGTAPWWVFVGLVVFCDSVHLHIQVRREAHAISLGELAAVIGLYFMSPGEYVTGRTLGCFVVFALLRRQEITKLLFNVVLYFTESVLAVAVFHLVCGTGGATGPLAWAGAAAAMVVASAFCALAVTMVIALVDGGIRLHDVYVELLRGVSSALGATSFALIAAEALASDPRIAVPLSVSIGLLLLAFRTYSGLSERHLNLERLYQFSHAVGSSPEVDEILAGVLEHAREVLRAEYAEVVFVSSQPGHQPLRVDAHGGDGLLRRTRLSAEEAGDPLWERVSQGGASVLVPRGSRDPAVRAFLARRSLRDAVLAPLRGESGIVGTIMIGDRMGEVRTFDEEDLRLLTTVANHASVALQNGRLIDRLRHDSLHDTVTGLPNRAMLARALTKAIRDVRLDKVSGLTVIVMDLVGFKRVNDTFGHQVGDRLLREIGERMGEALAGRGTLARLSGDEFAVVLPGLSGREPALEVGQALEAVLERPVGIEGVDIEVGVSIGISQAPDHGVDSETLLKRADAAMTAARVAGTGVRMFEPRLDVVESPERLALIAELRAGIQNGELELHVQPQASLRTGAITGAEVLVRWRHPRHGLLFPDEFIPLAERTGLIRPLTAVVLEDALKLCSQWRRAGHDLTVSVNLSARSTLNDELIEQVQEKLARHGVPPRALTLEITESSVITDPERTGTVLRQLHDLGVGLSLDDFGTGYSSLSYLRQLPVQEVKVDKSFVMTMRRDSEDATIVRSIIDLAANLGLVVVAEGVEDESTWVDLSEMGCDLAQGYFLAAPQPAEEFPAWLVERSRVLARSAVPSPRRG
ncbi:MAG: EAL domain-containing protein [Actinomycetales bacterium]|nr:EAL domain-containing protein [Actinomycetales bacterium]